MTIKTESRIISIALRLYRGGWNAGCEPDCFHDLEPNFPRDHEHEDGSGAILSSDTDAQALIDWWQGECDSANAGEDGESLQALTDDERSRGDEWNLIVDVEDL